MEVQALLGNCTMLNRLKTLGDLVWAGLVLVLLYCSLPSLLETRTDREIRQTAGQTSPGVLMVSDLFTLGLSVFITCSNAVTAAVTWLQSSVKQSIRQWFSLQISPTVITSLDWTWTEMFLNILNILDYP